MPTFCSGGPSSLGTPEEQSRSMNWIRRFSCFHLNNGNSFPICRSKFKPLSQFKEFFFVVVVIVFVCLFASPLHFFPPLKAFITSMVNCRSG